MARLKTLKLPKGVEIDEVSNDNLFTHPSAASVPTTLAVKDYLHDEIDKHDQTFMPDGIHRNAIINGNFDIWQRGTSFDTIGYTADRWQYTGGGGGVSTVSRMDTSSTEPFSSTYYLRRTVTTAATSSHSFLRQSIEDVRLFDDVDVTVSFWARSPGHVGKTLQLGMSQRFGQGGSSTVWIAGNLFIMSEQWKKYNLTIHVPSISGKTVGDGSFLQMTFDETFGFDTFVFDVAQVQLNIGDKPLPFSPHHPAEELALCQRHYRTWTQQTENGRIHVPLWPPMRVAPTMTASTGTISNITAAGFNLTHNTQATTTITASSEL